jgi:hypothetical protein
MTAEEPFMKTVLLAFLTDSESRPILVHRIAILSGRVAEVALHH